MMPLLKVDDLHTYYGSSHILFGVGLEVHAGEVVVLLGRNGAGKSTTLKSIMGIIEFRSGSVRFRDRDIGRLSSDVICRAGLGYVPEDMRVFKGMTVRENLEVARRPARDGQSWDEERIFELFLLDEPSEGLAPVVVHQMLVQLKALKAAGLTVLLSEQNLKFSLELADRAYIIEKGEIKYHGAADALRTDAELRHKYLMV
jgi:branched-chain amino acid transport system ATP-binding protein